MILTMTTSLLRWRQIILRDLKKKGKLLDIRDVFVGSICIARDLPLLTYNSRHFNRLKDYGLKML